MAVAVRIARAKTKEVFFSTVIMDGMIGICLLI